MFGNDSRMSQQLDNYITGHYGEDQFKTRRTGKRSKKREICPDCCCDSKSCVCGDKTLFD